MTPRAAVVVTGSELVRGGRRDANGPFLAAELTNRGLEPDRITIVGDEPDELETALREGLQGDLLVISGGLGPTHDDRTVELLARAAGLEATVDPELERDIEQISRRIAERFRRPYAEFEQGVRKQATVPEGGRVIGIAGTAPGLVVETDGAVAVVLPGPPPELRRLWQAALEDEAVQRVLARAEPPHRRILRVYGVSESAVARALAEVGGEPEGVQATICAHDGEIWVELFGEGEALAVAMRQALAPSVFAEDDRPVEELVLEEARAQGITVATAESCTGGLVAARLTSVAGASDVFRGGLVAYENDVKLSQLNVPEETLAAHGAVSAETAAAMAAGARESLGADVAVAVTGVAGPGGGTREKPVGLVYLHASGPEAERARELLLPGDREAVRRRATAAALHLVRELLARSRHNSV
ncbi:MAG: CinA family nicotinamide mononucleotide deamidase-related protein [Actinobacteria bacterium]|nr:MAG: CinA family nicotinamide mononucleotide deamidase-related protein [Actinomycetota bacterium]